MFVSISIAIRFSSRFFRSINNLINASVSIGDGKFDTKVPEVKTDKDLEILNKNFNLMIDRLRNQEQLTKRQAATLLRYANLEKGVYKDLTMYQRQVYKKALRDILGQKETFWQKSKRGWYSLGNTIQIQAKRARATWTKAMAGIKKVTVGTLDFINKYATKAIVVIAIAQMLLDAANSAGKFLGVIQDAPKPLQDLKNEIDAPIFFRIVSIPVLVGLILTFLIINCDFFERIVNTIKKALELISEGIL